MRSCSYHPRTILRSIRFAQLLRSRRTCCDSVECVGCDLPGKPDPADDRHARPDRRALSRCYRRTAAGCHGATGKLGPAPPLNDPLFAAIIPDDELLRVIRDGRTGTPMPAFARASGGSLTDAQVKSLAEGIKSHWKSEAPLDELAARVCNHQRPTTHNPPPAAERTRDWKSISAHAPAATDQRRRRRRKRLTAGAINEPAFLALISDQALRRIIITGRPDLGMPTYAENRRPLGRLSSRSPPRKSTTWSRYSPSGVRPATVPSHRQTINLSILYDI